MRVGAPQIFLDVQHSGANFLDGNDVIEFMRVRAGNFACSADGFLRQVLCGCETFHVLDKFLNSLTRIFEDFIKIANRAGIQNEVIHESPGRQPARRARRGRRLQCLLGIKRRGANNGAKTEC